MTGERNFKGKIDRVIESSLSSVLKDFLNSEWYNEQIKDTRTEGNKILAFARLLGAYATKKTWSTLVSSLNMKNK